MVQTDPLSLVFIGCFVFSGAFLLASNLMGLGHGHGLHLHTGHLHMGGHAGQLHLGTHGPGAMTHTAANAHPTRVAVPHHADATTHTDAAPAPAVSPVARMLGALNLNEVLVFLFMFGVLGYLLHNLAHAGAVATIIVAIFIGVGAAGAVNMLLLRLFGTEVGRLGLDSSQMEGRLATVSLPIRANGIGEIIFVGENGTRRSLGARSTDGSAIPRDAEVVIMGYTDGIAQVQDWQRFIVEARSPM